MNTSFVGVRERFDTPHMLLQLVPMVHHSLHVLCGMPLTLLRRVLKWHALSPTLTQH